MTQKHGVKNPETVVKAMVNWCDESDIMIDEINCETYLMTTRDKDKSYQNKAIKNPFTINQNRALHFDNYDTQFRVTTTKWFPKNQELGIYGCNKLEQKLRNDPNSIKPTWNLANKAEIESKSHHCRQVKVCTSLKVIVLSW